MNNLTVTKQAEAMKISQPQCSLWRKRGMPDTLDEGESWRRANIRPRSSGSHRPRPVLDPEKAAILDQPPAPDCKTEGRYSWRETLARCNESEVLAFDAYKAALARGEAVLAERLLTCHVNAVKAKASAEKTALEIRIRSRELLTGVDCRRIIAEILSPIRHALDALPKAEAGRCNPTSPAVARQTLSAWRDALYLRVQKLGTKVDPETGTEISSGT